MPSPFPIIRPEFTSSGSLSALGAGELSLLQYPASEVEPGPQQLWLRFRAGDQIDAHPLTGPACGGRVTVGHHSVVVAGERRGVAWTLWWDQPGDGLAGWSLRLGNTSEVAVEIDMVYLFDAALTPTAELRENEFYVSNYLDVQPLGEDETRWLAVRQNMPGNRQPWLAVGSTTPLAGWCTDARQLACAGGGLDLTQDLPAQRLQGEHTLVGLQTAAEVLLPGSTRELRFQLVVIQDHPAATDVSEVVFLDELVTGVDWRTGPPAEAAADVVPTLFSPVSWLIGEELTDEEFLAVGGGDADGVERAPDGRPWAYWSHGRHIVSAAKERAVLRPHGHIARVSAGPRPADVTVASTAWMNGTFASQLTVGHASADPVLSVRRSYLGLKNADGLRIFARESQGSWMLLGMPSAWEADGPRARWIYRWHGRRIEVRSELSLVDLIVDVEVVSGAALEILISAHSDTGAWPGESGALFADGQGRSDQWRAVAHPLGIRFRHRITLGTDGANAPWVAPQIDADDESVRRLGRILPAFVENAAVHYQAPRGLEQFTGGGWGTRDVSQGPVGLLLATDRHDVLRDVLLTLFSAQQSGGNWPQSFQYLADRYGPGHRPSHGDVVYWPLLALGEYLEASGDHSILSEEVPSVGAHHIARPTSILDHIHSAFGWLTAHRSLDPRLPAYGHGDWNDALQPANRQLARSMCSTWTTVLEIKTLETLSAQLWTADPDLARRMTTVAEDTRAAFHARLIIDGELCGYSIITESGLEPLVHPADRRTLVKHGSLQMIHAIGDELLPPREAWHHVSLIDDHLDGPAGIYLFDRPIPYHGGVTSTFLRAEAASFWGREIGLMYSHAHVRWVQALLRLGLAERAWQALQLLIPEGLRHDVPGAAVRQSNCYYSSSDAAFVDRYDAQDHPERLFDPQFPSEGGWRVYSSGPGLILRILVEDLLGCRWTSDGLHVDPVVPGVLDGAVARLKVGGREVVVTYAVDPPGHGIASLLLNGAATDVQPHPRRYRPGGVHIPRSLWDALPEGEVRLSVHVGEPG